MELKPRPEYLNRLLDFKDSELIKVVVGMRRCGKSSLLELFSQHLLAHRAAKRRIVSMNFEAAEYLHIENYKQLLETVQPLIKDASPEKKTYLIFDEIQLVSQWEKAINALRVRGDVDIYITGSNAYMLSSQLATLLSGRYVEINVYPLSFREFTAFADSGDSLEALFERYIAYGGLPPVVDQGENRQLAKTVLSGVYNTVFVKDIVQYVQVRNQSVFSDIAAFLADTSGSHVSISRIEKRLLSAHRKTAPETIEKYIQALVDSFLLYRAKRFDLRGGEFLQGLEKYYLADLGIRSMLLGFPKKDYGFVLENVVHNELVVRGYDVKVGKIGDLEIDFVAVDERQTVLVQVCASLLDENTRKRELEAFDKASRADGKRLLITFDRIGLGMEGNVEIVNALDWLMNNA